jgi:UDP-N-acetylglucosamine:LPS N-acetylglucosamine transferase
VEAGVTAYLGVHDNVTAEHIAKEIRRLYDRPADMKRMAEHAYKMVDAEGAGRVADAMLKL